MGPKFPKSATIYFARVADRYEVDEETVDPVINLASARHQESVTRP